MPIQRFEQLTVWQRAHALVLEVYKRSKAFPLDERFDFVPQIRRAAVSVPANLAEGFKRRTPKDKVHFYNISESSLEELKYYVLLSRDLGYWKPKETTVLLEDVDEISRLLSGLIHSICAG